MREMIFFFTMPPIHTGTCGTENNIKFLLAEQKESPCHHHHHATHSFISTQFKATSGDFQNVIRLDGRRVSEKKIRLFMPLHKLLTNLNEQRGVCRIQDKAMFRAELTRNERYFRSQIVFHREISYQINLIF